VKNVHSLHLNMLQKSCVTCGKLGPLKLQRCPSKGFDAMLAVSCDDCVDDTFQTVVTRSGESRPIPSVAIHKSALNEFDCRYSKQR
jgi:NAD-dependent SIR2 family protein deacetylase